MRNTIFLGFITCFCLVQCQSSAPRSKEVINNEVAQLKTIEQKQAYLETILQGLQELEFEREKLQYLDSESKAVQDFLERKAIIQGENYLKISAYFENFGYPSRSKLGQYAALAPYAVIYYSENPSDVINKEEFRYFYGAYKYGDIPADMFLSYLVSYHNVVTGQDIRINSEETTKFNIEYIFDLLGIEQ